VGPKILTVDTSEEGIEILSNLLKVGVPKVKGIAGLVSVLEKSSSNSLKVGRLIFAYSSSKIYLTLAILPFPTTFRPRQKVGNTFLPPS